MPTSDLVNKEHWQALAGRARMRAARLAQRLDRADVGRVLPLLLMAIGALMLLYVAFQYGSMYLEQRRLAAAWEMQNTTAPAAPEMRKLGDGLTRISIPRADIDAIVLDGTSPRQLRLGPGRMTRTAVPGEPGNAVITAHRDTFFRGLGDLRSGDSIFIRRAGRVFRYEVTGKKVVAPTDLSVLRQTRDPRLTLITCYPLYFIGPAPERLIITSRLVEETADVVTSVPGAAANP